MRNTLGAALLAIFAATSAAAYQNEPTGFRGIEWDTPVEQVQGLTQVRVEDDSVIYRRSNENMKIGQADLVSVEYEFFRGRFVRAFVETAEAPGVVRIMMETFRTQFGAGFQSNRFIPQILWPGVTTGIFLDCNEVRRQCGAIISSAKFQELQRRDRAAKAAGAKKDF